MFCITGIEGPLKVSLKVRDDEFHDMSSRPGIVPAPYVARYKWVLVEEPHALNAREWTHFVTQSYQLVKENLPKKVLDTLGKTSKKNKPAEKTKPAAKKKVVKATKIASRKKKK
jgi:predicted DNA-binding protein (MmcQ/YjbR family)